LKKVPHVGLGGRSLVYRGIGIDKGEILPLLLGEWGIGIFVAIMARLIHQGSAFEGDIDEHTLPC